MTQLTFTIGGKAAPAPRPTKGSLIADFDRRREFEETVKANWLACVAAYEAVRTLDRRIAKLQARLDDPAFAAYDWRHPYRIEAEQQLADLQRQAEDALVGGPSSSGAGGLQHQLACFVGLIVSTCDEREQAEWAYAIGGWNAPEALVLLHAIHETPEAVDNQPLWPAVMARFESIHLPPGVATWWSEQRELAARQAADFSEPLSDAQIHSLYRTAINPVAVPF